MEIIDIKERVDGWTITFADFIQNIETIYLYGECEGGPYSVSLNLYSQFDAANKVIVNITEELFKSKLL